MKRFAALFAAALGWLACAGSPAQADPIPAPNAQWSYNFTPNNPSFQVLADSGTGGVTLTNEPTKSATGSSDVVVTNITGFSAAAPGTPDTFGASSGNWSVNLVLKDVASGQTTKVPLTFSGKFGGSLSTQNSNVTNTYTPQTQTVTLGNFTYTVSLTSYTPPAPQGAKNSGSISAHIDVTQASGSISSVTPEPGSMALAGLGVTFAGLIAWRKRRRNLALALA